MSRREAIPQKLRFEVLRRDRFACRYCGAKAGDAKLHIDHRLAVKHGGTNDIKNLYTACQPCNLGKGVMDVHDAPIPHAVMLDLKFFHGALFAQTHSQFPQDWWDWLVEYYETGGNFVDLRDRLLRRRRDDEIDLAYAYSSIASYADRPSYIREAKGWIDDPVWNENVPAEEIRRIREWREPE